MRASGLNREQIKALAAAAMFLNHLGTLFAAEGTLLRELLLSIGYMTAISMIYFLTEGFQYTRNRKRYGLRLLLFAFLSQFPYWLALSRNGYVQPFTLNIFFTLFLCFLILLVKEQILHPALQKCVVLLLILCSIPCDWGILAPLFLLLFLKYRQENGTLRKAYLYGTLLFWGYSLLEKSLEYPPGINLLYSTLNLLGPVLSGILILRFYTGKQSLRRNAFSKWFFYLFYPAHLLLLGTASLWAAKFY